MHIALFTPGGAADHNHAQEDLSPQVDGSRLAFTTTEEYESGSLLVIYNGVTYTPNNDFTETGPKEFTFPFDGYGHNDLFPPKVGSPLYITYKVKLTV
jgi:hypothetical protein